MNTSLHSYLFHVQLSVSCTNSIVGGSHLLLQEILKVVKKSSVNYALHS